jgi:hypothetical protein
MKRRAVAVLVMLACLMTVVVGTRLPIGCCLAQGASPEMPVNGEEVLWTLEQWVKDGIAYYRLYANSEVPAVDEFNSGEVSQLQLPMHTYNGIALHRIVTLKVDDVRSYIHHRFTADAVLHPETDMEVLQSSWAGRAVTIDGDIDWYEWGDATQRNIQCEGDLPVMIYVKNDADALYLAISDPNDYWEGDMGSQLGIYFDGDHDGDWPSPPCPTDEGVLWFGSQASLLGERVVFGGWVHEPEPCAPKEMGPGADGVVTWDEGHAQWEVKVRLAARGLGARPGDTVGLYFWVLDWDTMLLDGEWPCALDVQETWMHPSEYGDLSLAEPPPEEFVPEPSSLVLLAGGLLALLGSGRILAGSEAGDV